MRTRGHAELAGLSLTIADESAQADTRDRASLDWPVVLSRCGGQEAASSQPIHCTTGTRHRLVPRVSDKRSLPVASAHGARCIEAAPRDVIGQAGAGGRVVSRRLNEGGWLATGKCPPTLAEGRGAYSLGAFPPALELRNLECRGGVGGGHALRRGTVAVKRAQWVPMARGDGVKRPLGRVSLGLAVRAVSRSEDARRTIPALLAALARMHARRAVSLSAGSKQQLVDALSASWSPCWVDREAQANARPARN